MPDLDERFRSLSRTRSPDLWPEVEGREPRPTLEPSPWRRALVAAAALYRAGLGSALPPYPLSEAEIIERARTFAGRLGHPAAGADAFAWTAPKEFERLAAAVGIEEAGRSAASGEPAVAVWTVRFRGAGGPASGEAVAVDYQPQTLRVSDNDASNFSPFSVSDNSILPATDPAQVRNAVIRRRANLPAGRQYLFWQRGTAAGWRERRRQAAERLTAPVVAVAGVALLAFGGLAGWIYYNTHVLNRYVTANDRLQRQADYEKRYKPVLSAEPQPKITAATLDVALYPSRQGARVRGRRKPRR